MISVPSSSAGIDLRQPRKPLSQCRPTPALRRSSTVLGIAALAAVAAAAPAAADFRICNQTKSRVGVAIGYQDGEAWVTEGWWNIPASSCDALLHGQLAARFYYVYAVDYDRNGEWSGPIFMCTRDKEFTIRGLGDCLARGYDRTGFMEVDTGNQQMSWTVQLTEAGITAVPGRGFGPMPGSPMPRLPLQPVPGMPPR